MTARDKAGRQPRLPLLDRLYGQMMGLRPPSPFSVEPVRIPMRDGVRLAADHYAPTGEPFGTVLFVTPYGLGVTYSLGTARRLAARGYHALFVSCRGTFGSEGTFDAMRDDVADNQDIVAWLRDQPWYTGSFATYGASYLGYTQWALLADPPSDLRAAVIAAGPHDFARYIWGTGTFNLDHTAWAHVIDTQEASNMIAVILQPMLGGTRRRKELVSALPILQAADAQLARRQPWLHEHLLRPDITDPFWAPVRHAQALEKVNIPVLLVTGWLDLFTGQSLEQYYRLRERGVDVALLAGPWTHFGASGGTREGGQEMLAWLDDKLASRAGSRRAKPAHVHVTGANEWREYDAWPPATQPRVLYLGPGGGLAVSPAATGAEEAFTYDPADPTPSLGGALYRRGGYVNDAPLAARADVLAFTGTPLPAPVEIAGSPTVVLDHQLEHPDADLLVRLSDVDERGRSRIVTEAYLRVQGGPVRVELGPAAHRFGTGHRVRLLVAGGSFPHFPPNPGTGENPLTATRRVPNRHAIALPGSFLELPQIPLYRTGLVSRAKLDGRTAYNGPVRPADLYHVGFVTSDFDQTVEFLAKTAGYRWAGELKTDNLLVVGETETMLPLRCTYSRDEPHVEVLQAIPGTLLSPSGTSPHHLGYWTDDIEADLAALAAAGATIDGRGYWPDRRGPIWAFATPPGGPRIELVPSTSKASMQRWWDTGVLGG